MPDREKVIYGIERCTCHVPDACRDCGYDAGQPYNACVELLLKDALELLKAQEQFAKDNSVPNNCWISVKYRLPEEGEEVLVWNDEGFCYVDEIKNGMWKIPGVYSGNTHWMPLPEPPKEET